MRQDALDKANDDPRGTSARILDAAEDLFAEHGYAGTSTRAIAQRARVPFGALHYHWGSKKHLWEAVFKRLGESTRDTILANFKPGGSIGETLDSMTDAFVERLITSPNTVRLSYRMTLERRELHVAGYHDTIRELAALGAGLLRDAGADPSLDAPAAFLVISNAFLGAIADWDAQEVLLGGTVLASRAARDRVRAELRRVARAVFKVSD
jgi:AcrR family transcriptional regulator